MLQPVGGSVGLQGIRAFADALAQVVWIAGPDGCREYFNDAWLRYTGMTQEASVGTGWQDALHPDDRDAVLRRWQRHSAAGEPYATAYRFRSASGDYRSFRGSMFPLRDETGTIAKWIGVCDDVEALSQARRAHDLALEKLAGSESKFRTMADALPLLVWTTDRTDRFSFVNRAWRDYTGLGVGTTIEERNRLVHPDDVERLMAALRGGEPEVEFRLRRASDGAYRWHLLRWERFRAGEDAPFDRIGIALDVHDQRMVQLEREQLLQTVAEAVPQIVWSIRADGKQDYVNDAWFAYSGLRRGKARAGDWISLVHPDDVEAMNRAWDEATQAGAPFEFECRLRRHDGHYRWFIARALPIRNADGTIARWFGTCTDIEDQKRASQEQAYLAELSRIITSSLDVETTLRHIARSAVPLLGDWCEIALFEPPFVRTAAFAHRNVALDHELQDLVGNSRRIDSTERHGEFVDRISAQHTILIERIDDELFESLFAQERDRELFRRAGLNSSVTVALRVGNEPIGTISFVRGPDNAAYGAGDVPLLEEVARRAEAAIANARLYQREHRVADALQSASLPKRLPEIPGLEMSAIYVPGQNEALIGGDWYDAFRLTDGRLVISMGDVAGSGLDAAVTMANMRQIIRGTAQVYADPAVMLNAADRALRLEDPQRFVTAFVGVIDPVERRMSYASAGHPAPYVRSRDGRVRELSFSDLPLGLRERGSETPAVTAYEDGDTFVFFTDGLVEASRDLDTGHAALFEAVSSQEFLLASDPARYVHDRLLPDGSHDDVAILALRIRQEKLEATLRWWHFDTLDGAAFATLRMDVRDALAALVRDPVRMDLAELVLGELVGNAIRHAAGAIDVVLDLGGHAPVLNVLDAGPGFERRPVLPADAMSESGRGLYIVSEMTREFSVDKRYPRGSHARAVLLS